jgi:hypothetical protein
MSSFQVTAIVPKLPPAVDGLGDYGWNLAKQLRQDFGIETRFIVGQPNWTKPESLDFEVEVVREQSTAALLELLPKTDDAKVLLHYVGYGYARRGCPTWLIQGLKAWRQQGEQRRLISMMHEIYATGGAIWSSVFWNSWYQKKLAASLIASSNICVTSGTAFVQRIQSLSKGKHTQIPTLPVFSNIGEPDQLLPLQDRQRRMIVFGGSGPRTRVYQRSLASLTQACQQLQIQEILDIGSPLPFTPVVEGCSIKSLGILPSLEISQILADSYAGFFDYPLFCIEKSGIFAAYCAHQVLPIGGSYPQPSQCGVETGRQYWQAGQPITIPINESAQAIAEQAYAWYQQHSLAAQAKLFARVLLG